MTGAKRDPGTSANFRYTTSTDMTVQDDVARLRAAPGAFGLHRGRLHRRGRRGGLRWRARGDGVGRRRRCGRW